MEHDMAQAAELYAILGVGRTADEREVKRAYFRLIRQYTPESHPEEFKRLRHAYEVLSDPAARADYDQLTQYGDDIGHKLRAGRDAMDRGDLLSAQDAFRQVLDARPDLHMARDLLGMAFLNNNQPREALTHFDLLVRTHPEQAAYHLHHGYAHYALDQYKSAVAAYERARQLDPGNTKILVALADCYTAMDRYDDALAELERALAFEREGGTPQFQDFVFMMRRVQIQLLRDRIDLGEQEIDRVVGLLPQDTEIRRYVAQKLCSLASQLFRIKRGADGNRLLLRAQRLHGRHAALPLTFPARVVRPLRALPRQAQAQIERLCRERSPHKLVHGVWTAPLVMLGAALALLYWPLSQALSARGEWRGNTWGLMLLLLFCGPLLLGWAAQQVYRAARSKVGRFTTIHPLYLLQVDLDRVTAWPLVNLHDVSMTHHLQNGVYQHTSVLADFAGAAVTLTIRGQQAAIEWAQALLDARHRCLGLMAVGMIDEEDGADLLPPVPPGEGRLGRARRAAAVALLAGCGLGLGVGGTALNRRAADRSSFEEAVRAGRPQALREYLAAYPHGERAGQAAALLGQAYADAEQRLLGGRPSAGRQALAAALAVLRRSGRPEAALVIRRAGERTGLGAPEAALADELSRYRDYEGPGLSRALAPLVSPDLLVLTEVGARDAVRWPVLLEVDYDVRQGAQAGQGQQDLDGEDGYGVRGMEVRWHVAMVVQGRVIYRGEIGTRPAPDLQYVRGVDDEDGVLMYGPYRLMAEGAMREFGRRLVVELGR